MINDPLDVVVARKWLKFQVDERAARFRAVRVVRREDERIQIVLGLAATEPAVFRHDQSGIGLRATRQPVRGHPALSLQLDLTSKFELERSEFVQDIFRRFGHVYSQSCKKKKNKIPRFKNLIKVTIDSAFDKCARKVRSIYLTKAGRLHSRRRVHSVAEEAVVRHPLADHPGANRAAVHADSHAQLRVLLVHYRERLDGVQYGQRHQSDLPRVLVAVPLRETGRDHVPVTYGFHLRIVICLSIFFYIYILIKSIY